MSIIKVNVYTQHEEVGSDSDWAEFEVTEALTNAVSALHQAVNLAQAHFIERFDYSPEYHWGEPTSTDNERLVVTYNGDFWWEGNYKHCDITFSTERLNVRDLLVEGDQDKRQNFVEDYE